MTIRPAQRLSKLPPYLFVEIDRQKLEAIDRGCDVIDFGIGDPDRPTPEPIVARMAEAIRDGANHRYASNAGTIELRTAFARFFARRYGVTLDPNGEVLVLLGAKEGIGHLPTAIIDPGDVVLVPEPGYPVYASGAILAGGTVETMPLRSENGWLPNLDEIPTATLDRARLLWLNYPNNPTTALAPPRFYEEVVAFARTHDILVAQDAAYNEIFFDEAPGSILQAGGAKETAVEFHSLSKTFNMTGWRIGFAVGNREAIAALEQVKSHVDSGVFLAVQAAAVAALNGIDGEEVREQIATYHRRRSLLATGLTKAGWSVTPPQATIFLWAKCPDGFDSMALASRLLKEASVVVIPGAGFGPAGEGYVRFSLTVPDERIEQAISRIGKLSW